MTYLNAFLCGGLLCAVGQILIDRTQLTPARILTGYVVAGVLLQAVGLYQPLVDWGGAGATVPLTGFGYCLAKGVAKAVAEKGLLGALAGGLTAAAAPVRPGSKNREFFEKTVDNPGMLWYIKSCLSGRRHGGVAQLARACGSYPQCHRFESSRRYHRGRDGNISPAPLDRVMARWSSG